MLQDNRTTWKAPDLGIVDEPLVLSLLKYRQRKNRWKAPAEESNLVSSLTPDGKHLPIIDLDFPHEIVESTTPGHKHVFFTSVDGKPISHWRWVVYMTGLYVGRQIELGFYVWSLRRGANFVRIPGTVKDGDAESTKATYGWFFKLKDQQ